jgi:hypothetical protein
VAIRVIPVDKGGNRIDRDNPLPTSDETSAVRLQNIESILVQGFLGNANVFLTDPEYKTLHNDGDEILTE